jgi:hypothetical protein
MFIQLRCTANLKAEMSLVDTLHTLFISEKADIIQDEKSKRQKIKNLILKINIERNGGDN